MYNLNIKIAHEEVLLLVKLQLYQKYHSSMGAFHVLNFTNGTKSRKVSNIESWFTNQVVNLHLLQMEVVQMYQIEFYVFEIMHDQK